FSFNPLDSRALYKNGERAVPVPDSIRSFRYFISFDTRAAYKINPCAIARSAFRIVNAHHSRHLLFMRSVCWAIAIEGSHTRAVNQVRHAALPVPDTFGLFPSIINFERSPISEPQAFVRR